MCWWYWMLEFFYRVPTWMHWKCWGPPSGLYFRKINQKCLVIMVHTCWWQSEKGQYICVESSQRWQSSQPIALVECDLIFACLLSSVLAVRKLLAILQISISWLALFEPSRWKSIYVELARHFGDLVAILILTSVTFLVLRILWVASSVGIRRIWL